MFTGKSLIFPSTIRQNPSVEFLPGSIMTVFVDPLDNPHIFVYDLDNFRSLWRPVTAAAFTDRIDIANYPHVELPLAQVYGRSIDLLQLLRVSIHENPLRTETYYQVRIFVNDYTRNGQRRVCMFRYSCANGSPDGRPVAWKLLSASLASTQIYDTGHLSAWTTSQSTYSLWPVL
jgi:hypothetical protein